MNAKTRIATLALAAMLFGSNAWADRPQYDYAKVISADPIINYVTVKTPVRECWEETRYYTVDRNAGNRRASTFLGAVIGGVVGHQFGSGRSPEQASGPYRRRAHSIASSKARSETSRLTGPPPARRSCPSPQRR